MRISSSCAKIGDLKTGDGSLSLKLKDSDSGTVLSSKTENRPLSFPGSRKLNSGKFRIPKPLLFLAVFILVNLLMTFLLTPFSSPSTEMWDGYYDRAGGALEMIYIGTSQCYESVNPEITEPLTGLASYNMGTNAQSLMDTKRALETAFRDHEVKETVLVLDYDGLMKKKDRYARPEAAFTYAMSRHLPLSGKILNALKFVFDPEYFGDPQSLNFFFPWLNNRSNMHFEYMIENASAKLTGKIPEADDINNVRNEYGYKGFQSVIDYNETYSMERYKFREEKVSERALATVEEICRICREEGSHFTVIVAPVTVSAVRAYGKSYFTRLQYVKEFLDGQGVEFYDFNLAKPELFERKGEFFKDWDHLNDTGAGIFSRSCAELYRMQQAGEDPEGLFYEMEEYLETLDFVDSTYLELMSIPGSGIQGKARSYTGDEAGIEYEIQVMKKGSSEFETIREYDTDPEFTYVPEKSGTVVFRVNARAAGSAEEYERYHVDTVEYWKV